jgi:capsular polysaccharide biosynthesis protein
VSDERGRRARHRQYQGGSGLTAAPAAPWSDTADPSASQDDDLPERLWALDNLDDFTDAPVADVTGGLVSLSFIWAALRRGRRFWCATAVIGLLIGLAAYKEFPPSYQASASVLLANNPFEQTASAALDAQAIAQSRTVAGAALRQLGLQEDPGAFSGDYTVTVITDRVLTIVVKARSYPTAVREANAVATAFLAYQKHQLLEQEALNKASLQQSVNQVRRNLVSLNTRINSVSAQPSSRAKRAELSGLLSQRNEVNGDLTALEESGRASEAATRVGTTAVINGSQVLDWAEPLPQHAKKYLLLYVGGGLFGGLVLGLAIVIIQALISDRLRRRDDIARTLGAPVKLSVGMVKLSRWRPGRRGLEAAADADIQRIAKHLGRAVMPDSRGVATLAVVPLDDPQVAALSLVSLALSCAQEGLKVIVADLCPGSPAARLLGEDEPGVHTVSVHGAHLIVMVPDRGDAAPAGPLEVGPPRRRPDPAVEPLAAAYASASLLLTLVSLDPGVGAEHLDGWSDRAVAVVTAGRSTAARIHAVGEMVRLAGVKLISAVLVGADKTDESLGEPDPPVAVGSDLSR